ncbi:MAG: hypothetical protein M0Q13_00205 [Methanothrix sp.]|jgi:hypothetical protein|nr:hypothetical protein [Methanothrix sp.]
MFNKILPVVLALGLIAFLFVGMAEAKTTINESQCVMDSYVTPSTATTLNSTSGMQINSSKDNRLILLVANTAVAAGLNVTVQKGVYFRSGLGNLTLTIPKSSTRLIGPLESSRFEQADGKIYIAINNTNGTVIGYRLPSS